MITRDKLFQSTELERFFKTEPPQQNEPARFQLTSCNSKAISTELTNDCRVGFKIMQNSVPSKKRASLPHVITPYEYLNLFLIYCRFFV